MRFSFTLSRGVALLGALVLAPAPAALATPTGGGPVSGRAATTSGGAEHTHLHLSPTSVAHASGSSGSAIVRTIVALVIVVVIIYAVSRVLKAVKGRDQRASGDGLRQIATLPLGTNKSIALVRSGSDIVLVGVSESGVTPIKTYTEAEAIANGIAPAPEPVRVRDEAEPVFGWLEHLRRLTVRS